MRLHELDKHEFFEWELARLQSGRQKYGDAHRRRYLLVDVVEELLDARNCLQLLINELGGASGVFDLRVELSRLYLRIGNVIGEICAVDRKLPDECTNDAAAGHRVWWSDRHKKAEGVDVEVGEA